MKRANAIIFALAIGLGGCDSSAIGESDPEVAEVRKTVSQLIDDAYTAAEACAKYGPDDPNDSSCAEQKIIEVKLRNEHHMCPPEGPGIYVFEPCGSTELADEGKRKLEAFPNRFETPEEYANEIKRLNDLCVAAGGGVSGSPDCDTATALEEKLQERGYCIDYQRNEELVRCVR